MKNFKKKTFGLFVILGLIFSTSFVYSLTGMGTITKFTPILLYPLKPIFMLGDAIGGAIIGGVVTLPEVILTSAMSSFNATTNIFSGIWFFILYTLIAPILVIAGIIFLILSQLLLFRIYLFLLRVGLPIVIDGLSLITKTEKKNELPLFTKFSGNLLGVLIQIGLLLNRTNKDFTKYLNEKRKEIVDLL